MKKQYFFYLIISVLFLINSGCSSDDDVVDSQEFLAANVNGVEFLSDDKMSPLGFKRIITPEGRINLYAKTFSANGYYIEMLIENYTGPGKYFFGDNFYNKSWVKFESPSRTESWRLEPNGALEMDSNFIEITSIQDKYIEGKISCQEMINSFDGIFGKMEGEFRLRYFD